MAKKIKKNPLQKNKYEIIWHIVNAGLSGLLVLLGAFTTGNLQEVSFFVASVTALIVFVTKFYDYWKSQESEYSSKIFNFVKI